ncbi:hypothetical protein C8R45DRAFT_947492 [Mycena sanguinolenta]|nr:hypothetical protein C8R45DRAFT_947492 [Mycena sanguinolenta]
MSDFRKASTSVSDFSESSTSASGHGPRENAEKSLVTLNSAAQARSHAAVVSANDSNSQRLRQLTLHSPAMRSAKATSRSSPFTAQHIARTAQRSARALSRTTEYFQGPGTESQKHRKWGRDCSADGYYYLGGREHPSSEGTRRAKAMVKGEDFYSYRAGWRACQLFISLSMRTPGSTDTLSPLGSHHHEDRDCDAESVSDVLRRVGIENCVAVSGFRESQDLGPSGKAHCDLEY